MAGIDPYGPIRGLGEGGSIGYPTAPPATTAPTNDPTSTLTWRRDPYDIGTLLDTQQSVWLEREYKQVGYLEPVETGNIRVVDTYGNPVSPDEWTKTGKPVAMGTGSTKYPERPPQADTYWQDNGDGTETMMQVTYDLNGTATGSSPVPNSTRKIAKSDTGSPLDPTWTTELPSGNVGIWNTETGTFDDSGVPVKQDQSAPDTKLFPDGSLHQWDAVANEWVEIASAPPKDTTAIDIAKMQIAANAASNKARMAFDASQNAAQRAFQAEQGQLDRRLTWNIEQGRLEQQTKDRQLAAAEAFAQYVNSVDPTALPAFLAAGGGKLGGGDLVASTSKGGNAITDKALLPAARQLGIAREEFKLAPFPNQLLGQGGLAPTPQEMNRSRLTSSRGTQDRARRGLVDQGGLPRMAGGGFTRARRFVVGDSPRDPRTKPEIVENPTNAPLNVVPNSELGRPVGLTAPWWRAHPRQPSEGDRATVGNPPEQPPTSGLPAASNTPAPSTPATVGSGLDLGITPADQALMDEVRRIRESVPQLEDPNYIYALDFWNQLPTWKKAYLLGLQAKTGIGAADWEAAAQQNRLGGLPRESIATRY